MRFLTDRLMEAEQACGAGYRERSPGRRSQGNGYRPRALKTRVGKVELRIPKLRQGSYVPSFPGRPSARSSNARRARPQADS